jgi:hypothetical protein
MSFYKVSYVSHAVLAVLYLIVAILKLFAGQVELFFLGFVAALASYSAFAYAKSLNKVYPHEPFFPWHRKDGDPIP